MARRCVALPSVSVSPYPYTPLGEDLESGCFIGQQIDPRRPVGGIGRGERGCGDQSGLGFDGDVRLVAVAYSERDLCMWRASGSTVEMIRSGATRWAIFHVPSSSCSTSWPATRPTTREPRWLRLFVLVLEGGQQSQGVVTSSSPGSTWPPDRPRRSGVCPLTRSHARTEAPSRLPGHPRTRGWRRSAVSRCPGWPPRRRAVSQRTLGVRRVRPLVEERR